MSNYYSTSQWRKVRRQVLQRDNYTCQLRVSPNCRHVADNVHHTLGRTVTGLDPTYLVAACFPCNRAIGKPLGDPPARSQTNW